MILHHDAGQQWRMNQEHIELIKLSDQPHINSQAVDTIKQYFCMEFVTMKPSFMRVLFAMIEELPITDLTN